MKEEVINSQGKELFIYISRNIYKIFNYFFFLSCQNNKQKFKKIKINIFLFERNEFQLNT